MNFEADIIAQMEAMSLSADDKLRWRPILMFAALRVSKPGKVLNAMQKVDPNVFQGRSMPAAITAVRRMLNETRSQMDLPNLPVSETQKENPKKNRPGKPTDDQLEKYRIAHCLPWIQQNGGEPRPEQLADFNWDLKPFPPKSYSTHEATLEPQQPSQTAPAIQSNLNPPEFSPSRSPRISAESCVEEPEGEEPILTKTSAARPTEQYSRVPIMPPEVAEILAEAPSFEILPFGKSQAEFAALLEPIFDRREAFLRRIKKACEPLPTIRFSEIFQAEVAKIPKSDLHEYATAYADLFVIYRTDNVFIDRWKDALFEGKREFESQ